LLPSAHDATWDERELFDKSYEQLRGDGPTPTELLQQVDVLFEDFAPILKLNIPGKTLVESYEETSVSEV